MSNELSPEDQEHIKTMTKTMTNFVIKSILVDGKSREQIIQGLVDNFLGSEEYAESVMRMVEVSKEFHDNIVIGASGLLSNGRSKEQIVQFLVKSFFLTIEKAENFATESAFVFIADSIDEDKSKEEIVSDLVVKFNLSGEDAEKLIYAVEPRLDAIYNERNRNRMYRGIIFFVIGIIITVGTYAMTINGGVYIIASGAIFWGFIDFAKSFRIWSHHRKGCNNDQE